MTSEPERIAVTQSAREAADTICNPVDNPHMYSVLCKKFAQAEARGRDKHNAAIIAMLDKMKTEASKLGQTDAVFWIVQIKRDIAALTKEPKDD